MSHEWKAQQSQTGESTGTVNPRPLAQEVRKRLARSEDSDQVCTSESSLGQVEDRAEGKTKFTVR